MTNPEKQAEQPERLDDMVLRAQQLRRSISLKNKELDALKEEKDTIDTAIADAMSDMGVSSISTEHATVSVTDKDIPIVDPENWDQLYQYIKENNAFYMLQRRLATKACEEAMQMEDLPFMRVFQKTTVSLRSK